MKLSPAIPIVSLLVTCIHASTQRDLHLDLSTSSRSSSLPGSLELPSEDEKESTFPYRYQTTGEFAVEAIQDSNGGLPAVLCFTAGLILESMEFFHRRWMSRTHWADTMALHTEIRRGSLVGVQNILANGQAALDVICPSGETSLTLAIRIKRFDIFQVLITAGANIDAADSTGCTPLHNAVRRKRRQFFDLLLANGANTNVKDRIYKRSPLAWAAYHNNQDAVGKLLYIPTIDLNIREHFDKTPLMVAAFNGRSEMVKLLLDAGALVDLRDGLGETALFHGVRKGHFETVRILLLAAANPLLTNIQGKLPIEVAKLFSSSGETRQLLTQFTASRLLVVNSKEHELPLDVCNLILKNVIELNSN